MLFSILLFLLFKRKNLLYILHFIVDKNRDITLMSLWPTLASLWITLASLWITMASLWLPLASLCQHTGVFTFSNIRTFLTFYCKSTYITLLLLWRHTGTTMTSYSHHGGLWLASQRYHAVVYTFQIIPLHFKVYDYFNVTQAHSDTTLASQCHAKSITVPSHMCHSAMTLLSQESHIVIPVMSLWHLVVSH